MQHRSNTSGGRQRPYGGIYTQLAHIAIDPRQLDETHVHPMPARSHQEIASPGNLVIIKIARMSDTQYSLTNQRAIENEEKWLGKLEHPNIIRLRTVAEREASRQPIFRARSDLPGNPWFLVTDYLPGGDLHLLNERRNCRLACAGDRRTVGRRADLFPTHAAASTRHCQHSS
jgi:hypothetical protein